MQYMKQRPRTPKIKLICRLKLILRNLKLRNRRRQARKGIRASWKASKNKKTKNLLNLKPNKNVRLKFNPNKLNAKKKKTRSMLLGDLPLEIIMPQKSNNKKIRAFRSKITGKQYKVANKPRRGLYKKALWKTLLKIKISLSLIIISTLNI